MTITSETVVEANKNVKQEDGTDFLERYEEFNKQSITKIEGTRRVLSDCKITVAKYVALKHMV